MSALAELKISLVVTDSSSGGIVLERDLLPVRFGVGAGQSGQHQTLVLANGDNTVSVPTGAVLMLLELNSSAPVLTVKGVGGDTGTKIVPTSNVAGVAMVLPLGTTPSLVINNAGTSYSVDATFV